MGIDKENSMTKTRYITIAIAAVLIVAFAASSFWRDHSAATPCQEHNRDDWQQPETIMDTIGVKPGMVIGEAGAGRGYFTFKLAKRVGATGIIYANDINEDVLKTIRERCEKEKITNIITILGKEKDPLFPVEAMDLVIMVYVFHDLEQPVPLMQNIKPSLKPGAVVVIVDRDPDRFGQEYHHFMKKEEVVKKIKAAGYEIVKIHTFLARDNIYVCRPE